MVFAVVADIGGQSGERVAGVGLADDGVELDVVGLGPAVDDGRQRQVAANVNYLGNLGIAMVFASAALAEVGRNMPGFQAGGVHRRQFVGVAQQVLLTGLLDAGVEQGGEELFLSTRWSA